MPYMEAFKDWGQLLKFQIDSTKLFGEAQIWSQLQLNHLKFLFLSHEFLFYNYLNLHYYVIIKMTKIHQTYPCLTREDSKPYIYIYIYIYISYGFCRGRQWHPTPVLLPGKSHGRRSLVGCNLWGHEESDITEWLHFCFHALEKEIATHSSVLAWRIPGMGSLVGCHLCSRTESDTTAVT